MYWTALILGFVGSLHCVVMCGPIAMALAGQQSLSAFVWSRILYNFGRIATYILMGLIFGLLGELFVFGGYQQLFSILTGALMIILALALTVSNFRTSLFKPIYHATNVLKGQLSYWLKNKTLFGNYLLGMLNGFLPCGLVYAAIAGALTTIDLWGSITYMFLFGLGTFPAMLVMALTGQMIKGFSSRALHRISTIFIFTLGLLLIIRGLDLNIPYLSPAISMLYPTADITVCE